MGWPGYEAMVKPGHLTCTICSSQIKKQKWGQTLKRKIIGPTTYVHGIIFNAASCFGMFHPVDKTGGDA